MTPLPFHCSRMHADFLRAPCGELAKVRGECEGCPDAKSASQTTIKPRKWNAMPRQAPKPKKPAAVTPATPKPKIKPPADRKCKNCGFHVGPNWSWCYPCYTANKKYKDDPVTWIVKMREIRRQRMNGTMRKGRKANDGGIHKGGIKNKS